MGLYIAAAITALIIARRWEGIELNKMQYWSYDLAPKQQRQQSDWSTTSDDYYPQTSVVNEPPRYPNVYKAFNDNYAYGGPKQESSRREDQVQHQQKPSSPKVQKKVRVTEPVGVVERQTEEDIQNREGREESIDTLAAGFIKRKHKGFELSKWNTFKLSS